MKKFIGTLFVCPTIKMTILIKKLPNPDYVKFWAVYRTQNVIKPICWGIVGRNLQSRTGWYSALQLDNIISHKRRNGYIEVDQNHELYPVIMNQIDQYKCWLSLSDSGTLAI